MVYYTVLGYRGSSMSDVKHQGRVMGVRGAGLVGSSRVWVGVWGGRRLGFWVVGLGQRKGLKEGGKGENKGMQTRLVSGVRFA